MKYLISNIHRSGSSMMMRCLTSSGMEGIYDKELDNTLGLFIQDDYHPNPNGFYQTMEINLESHKVVKYPFRKLLSLPFGEYNICFLKRNPAEIELSIQQFTPYVSWGDDMIVLEFYDLIINTLLENLASRPDVKLTVLNYADIINDPVHEFNKLVDAGWPIDPVLASSFVDSNLYRNKL